MADDSREHGRDLFEEEAEPGSSMSHLYRGEVHRMKLWRERLDRTTNWSVIVLAAILTWSFSSETNPHYVILVGAAALSAFLVIEARRFRGYDMWRSRVRLMQRNVWARDLDPEDGSERDDWRRRLADDYRRPRVKVDRGEAIAHRLRRVYLPLFSVLLAAWVVRITAFEDGTTWPQSAAVGRIPGLAVIAVVALAYVAALAVAYRPRDWNTEGELRGEVVGSWGDE